MEIIDSLKSLIHALDALETATNAYLDEQNKFVLKADSNNKFGDEFQTAYNNWASTDWIDVLDKFYRGIDSESLLLEKILTTLQKSNQGGQE